MAYRTHCRGCGTYNLLDPILDLGTQPLANGLLESMLSPEQRYPLELVECVACSLLQLGYDAPEREIFNPAYPFTTKSAGKAWLEHGRELADILTLRLGLHPHSRVMEIGSNDGSFLVNFNTRRLGVDPSAPPVTQVPTMRLFFGDWVPDEKQDLIYGVNVLAHMPDVAKTCRALNRSLAEDGTAVFEFPWAVDMLAFNQFDTIYHEHYSYFTVTALNCALKPAGLHVYDAQYLVTHGGSLRVFIGRTQRRSSAVQTMLDIEEQKLPRMLERLPGRVRAVKESFRRFLDDHPGQVFAYGAAAKGNTFLNYCNVRGTEILAVGDSSPSKIGKWLPGSRIPIIDEALLINWQPAYVVLLPWNWSEQLLARLQPLMPKTTFVTAIPELRLHVNP